MLRLQRILRIRKTASRQMSFSREQEHLRKMPSTLLQARHERKSQNHNEILRPPTTALSPQRSITSHLGWTKKATKTG